MTYLIGKTLAFGIPLIEKLVSLQDTATSKTVNKAITILILEPTRELALQVSPPLILS